MIIADELPEISSETLKDLIKNAKYTVVFPLLAGTWQTANLISSSQYALAIVCATTTVLTTLILIGTISLSDWFGRLSFEEKGES